MIQNKKLTNKQMRKLETKYKRLIKATSEGPVSKEILFEIVRVDGHLMLMGLQDTIGQWYPAVKEGKRSGYIQVYRGKPIAYLDSEEAAILAEL